MLASLLARRTRRRQANRTYHALVDLARDPAFFVADDAGPGVPDTVEGRFGMVSLMVFLVLHRLRDAPDWQAGFGQALFDTMFADMDRSLRELGVGDLSISKRVKMLAKGFYGRTVAYARAIDDGDGEGLAAALTRNVYGAAVDPDPARVALLADYVLSCVAALRAADVTAVTTPAAVLPRWGDPQIV